MLQALGAAVCLALVLAGSSPAEEQEEPWWFEIAHDSAVRIRITTQDGGTLGWDPTLDTVVNSLDPTHHLEGSYLEREDPARPGRRSQVLRFGFRSVQWWPLRLEVLGPPDSPEGDDVSYTLRSTLTGPRTDQAFVLVGSVEPGGTQRYRVELSLAPRPGLRFVRESEVRPRIVRPQVAVARPHEENEKGWLFKVFHDAGVRVRITAQAGGTYGWDPALGAVVNTLDGSRLWDGFYAEEEGFDGPYWMVGFFLSSREWWPLRLEVFGTPAGGDYELGGVLTSPPPRYGVDSEKWKNTIQAGATHRYRIELLPPPLDTVRFVREDAALPRFGAPLAEDDPRVFALGSVIPVALAVEGPVPEEAEGGATLRLSGRGWQVPWVHPEPRPGGKFGREDRLEYDATTRTYRYDLATETLGRGTWLLEVTLGGLGPYTVPFEVRAP
jgi:hypothetical protein